MFGKMMNRYYYGKSGKGDFEKDDLPVTRIQLFWEMLRIRFSALIRLNCTYAVVWLPAIFVIARAAMLFYSGIVHLGGLEAGVQAGTTLQADLTEATALFSSASYALIFQTLVLLVPCIAITGPFTAGLCYVTRNWARDEHAFAWADYKDAMKANWKQALVISTITGFMPLFTYVCYVFYGDLMAKSALFIIPQVLSMFVVALWACMLIFLYPQLVTYELTFRNLLKNSLLLAVARLPFTILFRLLSLVPCIIGIVVGMVTPYFQFVVIFLSFYYIFIGFSLSRFVGASFSNAVFDRYINVKIEGAQVGRGLYNEEDDDEDYEEDER